MTAEQIAAIPIADRALVARKIAQVRGTATGVPCMPHEDEVDAFLKSATDDECRARSSRTGPRPEPRCAETE